MKRIFLASLVFGAMMFTIGCKPKESAYRKAYEQAKQREIAAQNDNTYTNNVPVSTETETKNITVRKERISAIEGENGEHLNRYSVVIGSFTNPNNAKSLKQKMVDLGYDAVLAKNEMGMLRVIVSSFATKEEAASSRDAFKSKFAPEYSDAWLLERDN